MSNQKNLNSAKMSRHKYKAKIFWRIISGGAFYRFSFDKSMKHLRSYQYVYIEILLKFDSSIETI